jgi:hypothetical protein
MLKKLISLSCLLLFGFVVSAKADTIGPTNCNTCLGSSYTLTYAATGNPTVYDISLVIDTSATTLPGDFLNAAAIKITSNSTDLASAALLTGPATFNATVVGGLSAGGCSAGAAGFICSQSSTTGVAVGAGDIYTFEWQVTEAAAGDINFSTLGSSVKALYVTPKGKQNGLTSEDITLQPGSTPPSVPEPASLLLVCTGLLGAAAGVRHRFAR